MITLISQWKMIVQLPVQFSSFMRKSSKHLDGETYYTYTQYIASFKH